MTERSSYLLLDRIAAGGMAEVYRAKSLGVEGFERIVAIKRILPALADDAEFVSMFISEAKIAGQLSHANIVPTLELGKIGETYFIAMEYVWGKDLRRILRRFKMLGQPMPPPMAAWMVMKVLEGLDHAHRKRGADGRPLAIIHRDVSPQNVLVSYDGLVKVIDFGIAKAASRATQTQAGVIKGKLAYMSPEQVMGSPMDHRSDVFAASAILHELLTGEPVFRGASDIDVVDKVRRAEAAAPSVRAPHVPPELDAIVMKGLARDVHERWQTAGEMQDAIMRFIASTRPPYSTSELGKWMRIAFAPEIAKERAHLDQLATVSHAGARVAPESRSSEPAAEPSSVPPAASEELSQLLSVEQLEGSSPPPARTAPPRAAFAEPAPSAPARGPNDAPSEYAPTLDARVLPPAGLRLASVESLPPPSPPPALTAPSAGPAAFASPGPAANSAALSSPSDSVGSPPSPLGKPAPLYGGAPAGFPPPGAPRPGALAADTGAGPQAAPEAYAAPHDAGHVQGPASAPPGYGAVEPSPAAFASAPSPKRSSTGLLLVMAGLFALGVLGGAVAWVFLLGGRALLGF